MHMLLISLASRMGASVAAIVKGARLYNPSVFYNPQDLTSLRVGTDGSGGSPVVGDPVGMMLDSSGVSGTMQQFIDGQPELVTNGGFDTDNDWTKGADWAISGGVAVKVPGTQNALYQDISSGLTDLSWYKVTFDVTLSAGTFVVFFTGNTVETITTSGSYTFILQASATNDRLAFQGQVATNGTIDNVSIKEIPGYHAIAPSDAARPTLMDDPDTTWGPLTDNGQRGDELVTNGQFYSATNLDGWNQYSTDSNNTITLVSGEGVDIVGDGTSALRFEQTSAFAANGDYYELEIDVTVNPSDEAGIKIQYSGTDSSIGVITTSGIHKFTFQPNTSTLQIFRRLSGSVTDVRIRSVSVRKVLTAFDERGPELVTNGTFNSDTTGWTSASGATLSSVSVELHVTCTAPDTTGLAYQAFTTVVGERYEVTITKISQDAPSAWGVATTPSSARDLANFTNSDTGTVTAIFQATSTTSYVQLWGFGDGVSDGTTVYDNVSVKQVLYPNLVTNGTFDTDSDWTKGTGWSIGSGVASASSATGTLQQAGVATANKWYRIQFYISAYTSGTVTPNIGGVSGASYNSTGWKSEILRANGTPVNFLTSTFTGSIDNVSVQELPSTTPRSYYLDTDGADDWMQVSPTLNLGEQWWHVGGWQVDTNGDFTFATGNGGGTAGLYYNGDDHTWWNGSAYVDVTASAGNVPHIVTVEQATATSLSARHNGNSEIGTVTIYDASAETKGLVLFSNKNDNWANGLDGRFYGGAWGVTPLTDDELSKSEKYLAKLSGVTL